MKRANPMERMIIIMERERKKDHADRECQCHSAYIFFFFFVVVIAAISHACDNLTMRTTINLFLCLSERPDCTLSVCLYPASRLKWLSQRMPISAGYYYHMSDRCSIINWAEEPAFFLIHWAATAMLLKVHYRRKKLHLNNNKYDNNNDF